MGPATVWALTNPGYENVMNYILLTGGVPTCIADTDAHWQTHIAMIRDANTKGAAIHLRLFSPDEELLAFAEAVVAETGGTLKVLE